MADTEFQSLTNKGIKNDWMFWKKRRYVVAVFTLFGGFNLYSLRINLSIAIVAMTESKAIVLENNTVINKPEFDWDSKTQGLVLSSYFYGYITTQILGGWMAARIGGKTIYGFGIAGTAILTLLTPWLASTSVYLLVAARILQGVFSGVVIPSFFALFSKWSPPLERGKFYAIAFAGIDLGTITTLPSAAYLATNLDWSSVFYVFGTIGLIWFVFWWFYVANTPEEDKRISPEELKYIRESLGNVEGKKVTHPWKKFFTSKPLWAVFMCSFASDWGSYTLLTGLPTYMKDLYNFDLGTTGFLSSIPYVAMFFMIQISGHLVDWLCKQPIFTVTQVRKIFTGSSFILQGIFTVASAYAPTATGTVICLVFAASLGVFKWSGFGLNYLDLGPQHASVLMGISNTITTVAGVFTPMVTGYIVTTSSREEWQIVFYIGSGLCIFVAVVYALIGSSELQPWAAK